MADNNYKGIAMNDVVYNCCFMFIQSIKCRDIHWQNVLMFEL